MWYIYLVLQFFFQLETNDDQIIQSKAGFEMGPKWKKLLR